MSSAGRFAIAGLGFGIVELGTRGVDCAGLCRAAVVLAFAVFPFVATGLAADFFGETALVVLVRLSLGLVAGFFAAVGSSFFSVNSNAGFGRGFSFGPTRVSSEAGFTPAATAAFAAAGAIATCLGLPFG